MSMLGSLTMAKEEGCADHYYDTAYEPGMELGHDSALASHLQGIYQVGAAPATFQGASCRAVAAQKRLAETLMTCLRPHRTSDSTPS